MFKGQVRWPFGLPHLALPSLFFRFCSVFYLPFVFFLIEKLFFPLKIAFLFIFQCLPLFLLSLFCLPLFHFLLLCLSLDLYFFLPSCLSFLLSFGSLFLSLYLFFFLLCFCFMTGTTSKFSITKCFFINPFAFLVSCLVFSLKSLFLIFICPDYMLCFLFNMNVFKFQKRQVKTQMFGQERGCN